MKMCSVCTYEYETNLSKLLERRLTQSGFQGNVYAEDRAIEAEVKDEADLAKWCEAIARLLMMDLSYFEVATMVSELQVPLREKRKILSEAILHVHKIGGVGSVKRGLMEHFQVHDSLVLEGFMRFRMKDVLDKWELCVDRAAEDVLVKAEYMELMSVLSAFVQLQPPKMKEISLILNPDGSCTLTDNSDSRIDCSRCSDDGVVGVLVGLAPEKITVYDLSEGRNHEVAEALMRVFEDRIRFFK